MSDYTPFKIKASLIKLGDRIRIDMGNIGDLAKSIEENGCIHPPTVDENFNLIAGGRRFTAMTQVLKWEDIPVNIMILNGSEAQLSKLELIENVERKAMTWQEQVQSVARVHVLQLKEQLDKAGKWTMQQTGRLLGISFGNVQYCITIAKLLKDPKHPINEAESLTDALKTLIQLKEDEANAKVSSFAASAVRAVTSQTINPGQPVMPTLGASVALSLDSEDDLAGLCDLAVLGPNGEPIIPSHVSIANGASAPLISKDIIEISLSKYLFNQDCVAFMNSQPAGFCDHIVTDPPYGIDMENLEQQNTGMKDISSIAATHDVDSNIKLFASMLPLFFKAVKPLGFCVFWCDQMHWEKLHELAVKAGFAVQRWPLVWVKTSRCMNQAASFNYTKATEVAMVCRKPGTVLQMPMPTNYWVGGHDELRRTEDHPFVKPEALWRWIFQGIANKGHVVYDPFAGVGSSCIAAAKHGLTPVATEIDPQHFSRLQANMQDQFRSWYPGKEVQFN